MEVKEWAKLQESLLKSQLKIVREFLRHGEEPRFKRHKKGPSQMSIIYDILISSPNPLHITEIIARAKQDFSVDLDRESIASALSKKSKKPPDVQEGRTKYIRHTGLFFRKDLLISKTRSKGTVD